MGRQNPTSYRSVAVEERHRSIAGVAGIDDDVAACHLLVAVTEDRTDCTNRHTTNGKV